ncbi:hypothetical protein SDRG_17286 [Saprolegnia diclina VS20]|uniref:Ricin B lectin domain-containing protein n=1 Tax=Saprolegnia diclina (strain VS20) TaxID=1156394 RepID=T0R5P7_SAPDV|nr:hypothetical protein SDRG_17286 [Saprolegnia diclina VS20]EQC24822.1 hypothetical protein SDRG_17286 [Saprolegnia diclina VS20]|eukprot:XP_008621748.1 hypothetical protein SDRG_17286 [Saprolegnia diclina VS20]
MSSRTLHFRIHQVPINMRVIYAPLILAASALGLATSNTADALPLDTIKAVSNETETVVKGEFPSNQWGLQRLNVWTSGDSEAFHREPLDQWVTVWGGVVNLRCRNCGGGRAWQVMQSEGSNDYDMLRNVQDNLCLDAYWSNDAGKPLVHGYQCQQYNSNQRWEYSRYNSATMIRHKVFWDWCLLIYPNGDATMANCAQNWNDVHFNFVA